MVTRRKEKFEGCAECTFFKKPLICRGCEAGELFEVKEDTLDGSPLFGGRDRED